MPTSTKLMIYMALWKRPEITEICFAGVNRLRNSGLFPIEAFAVLSEESMIPLCEKYDIKYVYHANLPLGEKKNFGLFHAYKHKWDYLIEIGSDDVLKTEYLHHFAPYFGKVDLLGINNFCYINSEDLACRQYKGVTSYGVGRAISRRAIDRVGTSIWNSRLNKGLDNSSNFFMARHGVLEQRVKSDMPLAIDIKSETNIWEFNYLYGKEYPLEQALAGLSIEEVTKLKALCSIQEGCPV